MKIGSLAFLAFVLALSVENSFAFSATQFGIAAPTRHAVVGRSSSTSLRMSTEDQVAKLRAAAQQARDDAARLAKELGKEEPMEAAATAIIEKSTKSAEEIASEILAIDYQASAREQLEALDKLRNDGCLALYKSATAEAGSGDLKSYPVSLKLLEQRAGLTAENLGIGVEEVGLDDFKYATLYVLGGSSVAGVAALAFLPENIGATVCYLVALFPILFLGLGSTAPAAIANVIAAVKGDKDDISKFDRVCRHEAAHFLCGYLCGLPIADYTITEENVPRVEFHETSDGPLTGRRELSSDEVCALSVVGMSGAVAEAIKFGKAAGANADLMELEGIFRRSADFLGAEKQQDLTRWGALTAYRLLADKQDKLDKLVDAFSARKSVGECIALLEQ